jgi:hypothetical protein
MLYQDTKDIIDRVYPVGWVTTGHGRCELIQIVKMGKKDKVYGILRTDRRSCQ